jgi:hypothetical protein
MLISTALLLDSNIRNSVCTPAKLPCGGVVEGNKSLLTERVLPYRSEKNYIYTIVEKSLIAFAP